MSRIGPMARRFRADMAEVIQDPAILDTCVANFVQQAMVTGIPRTPMVKAPPPTIGQGPQIIPVQATPVPQVTPVPQPATPVQQQEILPTRQATPQELLPPQQATPVPANGYTAGSSESVGGPCGNSRSSSHP